MDYLHEIAQVLLPGVRDAARRPQAPPLMRDPAARCEKLVSHRFAALRAEQKAIREAGRQVRAAAEETTPEGEPQRPAADTWLHSSDPRAIEFLADALAQSPDQIPAVILVGAPKGFYPASLTYLRDTVAEAAQPQFQPQTLFDRLWWHVWTWIAVNEYAAQLRDRSEHVARALAKSESWGRLQPRTTPPGGETPPALQPTPPSEPRTRRAIRSSKSRIEFRDNVKIAVGDMWDAAIAAVGLAPSDDDWKRVSELLSSDLEIRQVFLRLLTEELLTAPDLVRRLAEVSGAAIPFNTMFDVELLEIRASRAVRTGSPSYAGPARSAPRAAADLKLFGVALSGGGIRSATFNLGILQGLAGHRHLRQVDYLSTVSGGGYVGAWLASWIKRTGRQESGRGVQVIEDRLHTEPIGSPNAEDVRAVRFLREYSNYLTPRPGFFSADTWTMLAIWLRNTMLNQAVLILALAGILMVPWTTWFTLSSLITHPETQACVGLRATAPVLTTIATALIVIAAAFAGQQLRRFNLPPAERAKVAGQMLGQMGVIWAIVLPVFVAAFFFAIVICSARPHLLEADFRHQAVRELAIVFAFGLGIVAVGGRYWACFIADRIASKPTRVTYIRSGLWAMFIIGLAIGVASFAGASIIVGLGWLAATKEIGPRDLPISLHMVAFAVPVLIGAMSIMVVLKVGILGRNLFDEHREWWSRLGAWLNIVSLVWLALFVLGLYSPYLVSIGQTKLRNFILTAGGVGWAAWTAAGVLLEKSGKAGVGAAFAHGRARALVAALAPYVFIAGLLVIVSTASFWLIVGVLPLGDGLNALHQTHWTEFGHRSQWILLGPAGLMALAFLLSCRVDVNEFSMHHFYKNRLVRCYLGAARDSRTDPSPRSSDPFTGFDAADDLSLADLQLYCGRGDEALRSAKRKGNPRDLETYVGPIPIVNTALNLVKGDDLAWQERKAQSFVFTPFYSGYDFQSRRDALDPRFAPYGFRPTRLFGYPPFGIGTGTAVAISGAAASPNMGYHSSPAAAFLMTMFNARLGWWMGNPRDKYNWLRSTPRRGLLYLLNELLGLTNDRSHFVNLSDGGHFENLGIYELVRRQCRYIVACDAEEDTALTFNGLGNAIRKCRMDFGAEITVRATRIQPPAGAVHSTLHCVVGDIKYPNGEVGTLLYLKASVTGDEPADVLEYQSRQPSFPHHSTIADQFFDESQFESYRKLGAHIAQVAFAVPDSEEASLAERFGFLRDYWYPASSRVDPGGLSAQYEGLLDRVRTAQSLDFIDPAFFDPAGLDRAERQQLFVGASMLDLMQRVFIDPI